MDNNQEGRVHFTDQNMCHCGGRHHGVWRLLRLLVVLLLIALAFLAGAHAATRRFGAGYGMMGGSSMMSGRGGTMGWGQGAGRGGPAMTQVFGTISQIAGPVITVTDNGGKTQTVVSQSNTVIAIGNQEITLASLKTGQTISAVGILDTDGRLQAQMIQLAGL
jgi:hypothetical protein